MSFLGMELISTDIKGLIFIFIFSWEDFISNLGGVMSLCLGFSLLSLIEVIYFFTMRQLIDRNKRNAQIRDQINNVIIPSIHVSSSQTVKKTDIFGVGLLD